MEYSDIKNFNDLCYYGSLYTNDIVKKFLGWGSTSGKSLYELQGKYEWIGKIVHSYNLLGFCTQLSQPGVLVDCSKFEEYKDGNYKHGQRARIRGFMLKDKALKIYEYMKKNKNYVMSLSCKYNNIPFDCTVSSIIFKDDEPEKCKMKCNKRKRNDKSIPKHSEIVSYFGQSKKLPTAFSLFTKNYLINMESKYFEDDVIVVFDIMDKRWNYNDELWTDLLKCLYYLNN